MIAFDKIQEVQQEKTANQTVSSGQAVDFTKLSSLLPH